MIRKLAIIAVICCSFSAIRLNAQTTYHLADSIAIGGTGGWDYLSFDQTNRMLYVAHSDEIDVIDPVAKKLVATIPAHGSHGVVVANEFKRGFFTNGKTNTVGIFDLSTYKLISEIPVDKGPDAIVYDSATKRVFAICGDGNSTTVIQAGTGKVLGSIALGGSPEFGIADGKGHLFLNLEDKNLTLQIDTKKMKVTARWKIGEGEGPKGIALDGKKHRLFIGCHNEKMVILNSLNGKVLEVLPIGKGTDANGFDPAMNTAFSSNGEGTLTVVDTRKNNCVVSQTLSTDPGSKTMALDLSTHTVYLGAANYGAPAPNGNKKPKAPVLPNTFRILVVSPN